MKRLALFALGLVLSTAIVAQPEARRNGQQRGPQGGDCKMKMEERLNLNETQQKQIDQLRLSHRSTTQDYRNELDIKQAQLKAAVSKDPISDKKINALVSDINDLNGKLFAARVKHKLEVRALLDEDQKVVFDDMGYDRGQGRGYGRKGGPNRY